MKLCEQPELMVSKTGGIPRPVFPSIRLHTDSYHTYKHVPFTNWSDQSPICVHVMSRLIPTMYSRGKLINLSSVIWPNTIILPISTKYSVMVLKSPKYFGQCFSSPIFLQLYFFLHQILVPFLCHQNNCSFCTQWSGQRALNHEFWHISTKFCGQKMNCQKMF